MLKLSILLATLALSTAAVAAASTYYRYETENGSIAFTDDRETIPERYQKGARMIVGQSLFDYERTTISDRAATRPEGVPHPGTVELAPEEVAALGIPTISVEVAPGVFVEVPVDQTGSEEPINVEQGWVQRDGTLYPYTVVKRGDEVLLETYDQDLPIE